MFVLVVFNGPHSFRGLNSLPDISRRGYPAWTQLWTLLQTHSGWIFHLTEPCVIKKTSYFHKENLKLATKNIYVFHKYLLSLYPSRYTSGPFEGQVLSTATVNRSLQ